MTTVTFDHIRGLADAECQDAVLAINRDGTLEVQPRYRADRDGLDIIADRRQLDEYADGTEVDDGLAAGFAAGLTRDLEADRRYQI